MKNERRFELVAGSSRKFWSIWQDGNALGVRFGRIGLEGQTKTKKHGSREKAESEAENLIREKLGKGYQEIRGGKSQASAGAPPTPKRAPHERPALPSSTTSKRAKSKPGPKRWFEFVSNRSHKFWCIWQEGRIVTTAWGPVESNGFARGKSYADERAAGVEAKRLIQEKLDEGYSERSRKPKPRPARKTEAPAVKLAAAKPAKLGVPPKPKAQARAASPSKARRTAPAQRLRGRPGGDPYADASTEPVFHRIKLGGSKGAQPEGRATSGGRPILAEGQAVPVCGTCHETLGVCLQFDIEERFGLAFRPGSHFCLFACTSCQSVPPFPSKSRLTKEFLNPSTPATHRVILNPPEAREVLQAPDRRLRAQPRVGFEESKETLTEGLDCTVGVDGIKLGGAPHWTQPPRYFDCACGAPLGFVLQVPEARSPGWKTKSNASFTPFLGNGFFVFACTAQCNPYAAIVIAE